MKKERKERDDVQSAKKRFRAGVTVKNLGTHRFTTQKVLEAVADVTAKRQAAKAKGKGKARERVSINESTPPGQSSVSI